MEHSQPLANLKVTPVQTSLQSMSELLKSSLHSQVAYHELDEVPLKKIDQIELLQKNINQLSQLSLKLNFISREIRYLMKA